MENWNGANAFIFYGFYGRAGDFATNQREETEVAMLYLHLLHFSLVYINTLLIQLVMAAPDWADRLTAEDGRGLTSLIYSNVNPYGMIRLDVLPIDNVVVA